MKSIATFSEVVKEFKVSNTGDISVSVHGLSRLTGVHRKQIQKIMADLGGDFLSNSCAKFVIDQGYRGAIGGDFSGIISDELAAYVIEYYAFEAPTKRAVAVANYRAFARVGIRYTIHQVTNWQPPQPEVKQIPQLPRLDENRGSIIRPIVNQHNVLMELVKAGVLTHNKYITTKYKYKLTDYGKELGYSQTTNGTVFDPKL